MKAERKTIVVGVIELEVFMMPDGTYRLSHSQVTRIVNKPPKRMVELSQSERGKNLAVYIEKNGLAKFPVENAKPSNLVTVDAAVEFWSLEKVDEGLALVKALAIESLERRADAAFGKSRTEEERNARLALRMVIKKDFRTQLTDHLKEQGATEAYHYINAVNKLNKAVGTFGIKRDDYTPEQLARMDLAQKFIGRRMEKGIKFYEALTDYIEMM